MLGEAAMRIIRTKWKEPFSLAQELYTLLSKPLDIQPSSITINQPPGATLPPIVINQPAGTTVPPIQITRGDETVDLGSLGGGGSTGGGGIDLGSITFPEPGDTINNYSVPPVNENPIALHGRILGKAGGSTYSVRVWGRNPNVYPALGTIPVEFPDVSFEETIPVGTRCPVIAFPGTDGTTRTITFAIGYVPVFLAPEE